MNVNDTAIATPADLVVIDDDTNTRNVAAAICADLSSTSLTGDVVLDRMTLRIDAGMPEPLVQALFNAEAAVDRAEVELTAACESVERAAATVRYALDNHRGVNGLGELQSRGATFDRACALREERIEVLVQQVGMVNRLHRSGLFTMTNPADVRAARIAAKDEANEAMALRIDAAKAFARNARCSTRFIVVAFPTTTTSDGYNGFHMPVVDGPTVVIKRTANAELATRIARAESCGTCRAIVVDLDPITDVAASGADVAAIDA